MISQKTQREGRGACNCQHQCINIFIKMRYLWRTDVSLIRLGEDGDEHCEGSVVVKDSQNQPNPLSIGQIINRKGYLWFEMYQLKSVKEEI